MYVHYSMCLTLGVQARQVIVLFKPTSRICSVLSQPRRLGFASCNRPFVHGLVSKFPQTVRDRLEIRTVSPLLSGDGLKHTTVKVTLPSTRSQTARELDHIAKQTCPDWLPGCIVLREKIRRDVRSQYRPTQKSALSRRCRVWLVAWA